MSEESSSSDDSSIDSESSDEYVRLMYGGRNIRGERAALAGGDGAAAGDGGDGGGEEEHFDITLTATHSYLSPSGLAMVSGRSVLEAGWRGRVPGLQHAGVVYPGETVPLLLVREGEAAAMRRVINTDRLFCLMFQAEDGRPCGYGALCEVFEAGEGGAPLACKARVTQRVRVEEATRPALVRVLPELATAGAPLRSRGLHAELTPWPQHVYSLLDPARTCAALRAHFASLGARVPPEDPASLSYWAAANLPLSHKERLALFVADDAHVRLYLAARHTERAHTEDAESGDTLRCTTCGAVVSHAHSARAMSSAGLHCAYTNMGGYVHHVVTVAEVVARGVYASGAPSNLFSWFPGYSWTVMVCSTCHEHVGWRFDALKRNLRPTHFYGLSRSSVQGLLAADINDPHI